ncbi:MAG: hypothetical protein AAFR81_04035 [Chloroflexota bacterium]
MRRTKKYKQAIATAKAKGITLNERENANVYDTMNSHNLYWNHKNSEWFHADHAPSNSVFEVDARGESTGVAKIRVMCHPNDVRKMLDILAATQLRIVSASDPYPNRNGIGVRVYVEAQIASVGS